MNTNIRLQLRALLPAALLLALLPGLGSCLSMAQMGSVDLAYKYYGRGDYVTALRKLNAAESYGKMPDARHAEVCYLKGRCLEGLNNRDEALSLYEYLIKTYPGTEFAARAKGRIEELRAKPAPPPASPRNPKAAAHPGDKGPV